ncbi:MAG: Uma2 family endonuclease, partial [Saprospiraceae bacterium]
MQPDLCIICNPALIEERGCFGVPDLIIEILSPFSAKKDINNKYDV